MDLASNKRVSFGTSSGFTSYQTTISNQMFCRGACQDNTRGLRPPIKGGNSRNPDDNRELTIFGRGQRPVINLKGLNSFIKIENFKMESLHLLPDLIQSQDWMVKLDLTYRSQFTNTTNVSSSSNGNRKHTSLYACPLA